MTTKITATARNVAVNAITALLNAGGAGTLEIRSGTQPLSPATAPADGALLATLTFATDAFNDASLGVATAAPITPDPSADATGTASWFRAKSGAGTAIFDGAVGQDPPGTAELILNTVNIVAGGPVQITSFTFTVPASE